MNDALYSSEVPLLIHLRTDPPKLLQFDFVPHVHSLQATTPNSSKRHVSTFSSVFSLRKDLSSFDTYHTANMHFFKTRVTRISMAVLGASSIVSTSWFPLRPAHAQRVTESS